MVRGLLSRFQICGTGRKHNQDVFLATLGTDVPPMAFYHFFFASWKPSGESHEDILAAVRKKPRRNLAEYFDAFTGLVKRNKEMVQPSRFK